LTRGDSHFINFFQNIDVRAIPDKTAIVLSGAWRAQFDELLHKMTSCLEVNDWEGYMSLSRR